MGKKTYEGEYGGRFRRSRHRTEEAEAVLEGLNAVPSVDLLSDEAAKETHDSGTVLPEVQVTLNEDERFGLGQYIRLGGAVTPLAAELRIT